MQSIQKIRIIYVPPARGGGSLLFKKRNLIYFLTVAHWTTLPASHIHLSENCKCLITIKWEASVGKMLWPDCRCHPVFS
jgi:hypothetical protein